MDFCDNYSIPYLGFDSDTFIHTVLQDDGFSAENPLTDLILQSNECIDGREVEIFNDISSISTPRTNELQSPICTFFFSPFII